MVQYICDICKTIITSESAVNTIILNNDPDDHSADKIMHVCDSCHTEVMQYVNKLIKTADENRKKAEEARNREYLEASKQPKSYDYANNFNNMPLREFLQTPFYLQSQDKFIYRTLDNKIIRDYEHWMSHRVVMVNTPTKNHPEVIVTLD